MYCVNLLYFSLETFKSPTNTDVLELVQGSTVKVSVGIRHLPSDLFSQYFLRLRYRQSILNPNVRNNYEHYLTLDLDSCVSAEEGTKCKQLEVDIYGSPEMDNQTISLVVYKLNLDSFPPLPQIVRDLESQSFTIKVIGKY